MLTGQRAVALPHRALSAPLGPRASTPQLSALFSLRCAGASPFRPSPAASPSRRLSAHGTVTLYPADIGVDSDVFDALVQVSRADSADALRSAAERSHPQSAAHSTAIPHGCTPVTGALIIHSPTSVLYSSIEGRKHTATHRAAATCCCAELEAVDAERRERERGRKERTAQYRRGREERRRWCGVRVRGQASLAECAALSARSGACHLYYLRLKLNFLPHSTATAQRSGRRRTASVGVCVCSRAVLSVRRVAVQR